MLSRSFTKAELQINQLKHKQLPPQIDFAKLQNDTRKLVHYLIKHEEILPHKKHDSRSIGATKKILLSLPLISHIYNCCTPFLYFLIQYLLVRHIVSPPLNIAYRY